MQDMLQLPAPRVRQPVRRKLAIYCPPPARMSPPKNGRAVEAYRMLIAQGNADIGVRLEYADALRQAGTLGEAEAEYNRVLHDDAANTEAKIGLSKVLAQSGRIDEAMYLLDQLETDPRRCAAPAWPACTLTISTATSRKPGATSATCGARAAKQSALDLIQQQADWKDIRAALAGVAGNDELLALADEIINAERTQA